MFQQTIFQSSGMHGFDTLPLKEEMLNYHHFILLLKIYEKKLISSEGGCLENSSIPTISILQVEPPVSTFSQV